MLSSFSYSSRLPIQLRSNLHCKSAFYLEPQTPCESLCSPVLLFQNQLAAPQSTELKWPSARAPAVMSHRATSTLLR